MRDLNLDSLRHETAATDRAYLEFLRVPAMSMGLYRLKAGDDDRQQPHTEDEAYYVIRGCAGFKTGAGVTPVGPGTILFVERNAEHRFVDIAEDLDVLVIFAPAEHSLKGVRPSLDEVLAPLREEFERSGMSEEELTELLETAKHEMRARKRRPKSAE